MGIKARKALKKSLQNRSAKLSIATARKKDASSSSAADFLPLEGGKPARKLPAQTPLEDTATVLYLGRIPHGFHEDEMRGYFAQFGTVKRLRLSRNKKTGNSKHYGFIEFESPEVAKIVAEAMHNQLLFEHLLQVHLVPPERVHPKLWKGLKRHTKKPLDYVAMERKRHDKERTTEEQKKLVEGILRRDQKRRKRIEAAGIDYVCPPMVGEIPAAPKKIKFDED